jgi:hypothetical protein
VQKRTSEGSKLGSRHRIDNIGRTQDRRVKLACPARTSSFVARANLPVTLPGDKGSSAAIATAIF